MRLATALHASEGICCFVGAGGKKTTMYALAPRIDRAVLTTTVRIPPFESSVADFITTADPATAISSTTAWPVGLVSRQERHDLYRGYEPETIERLVETDADAILVKADGARMRQFKAPDTHEPQIPRNATTVVPIASAHVVGKPLDSDRVHRVNRVADISGLQPGDPITADAVGQVLASSRGGMKDVPTNATVVPLVNMVDDDALRSIAEEIADAVHRHADVPHVVLAAMREPDPLVAVC